MTTGMVGNVATEPEVRFSKAGKAWCSIRLSVKPYVAGAIEQPEPEFFDVVAFGSLAENVAEVARKGSRVVVTGRLDEDTWTGRDGTERVSTKIIADGIGPDLRFGTVTFNRTQRTTPTPVLDSLVGPERPRTYTDQPF
jgi:single-strand DNA-binding protein